MEVNKRNKREKAGGIWLAACRSMIVMLFVMLVFTMMPLLAPGTGQASAASKQPAMWFMDDLNITQVPGGDFSHKNTKNFDVKGVRNKNIKAPFDCKIVERFTGESHGNTVIIQSTSPVLYANGSEKYLSMAFAHDPDISDCPIGKTYKQGAVICQNGAYGYVTGVHSHVTCMEGKYTDHPGWQEVKIPGRTSNWTFKKAIDPRDCLFLSTKTKIYETKGMKFKVYKDTPTDIKPTGSLESVSASPGQILVSGWALDGDQPKAAIKVYVYLDSEKGECIGKGVANLKKYDVSKAGGGDNHSFQIAVNTKKYNAGNHKIYVKANNINKSGGSVGWTLLPKSGKSVNFLKYIDYKVQTGEAEDITNTSATIVGSLEPAGVAKAWGFYFGRTEAEMNAKKYTVSTLPTKSTNMRLNLSQYFKLEPGKKYYYKIWANVNDQDKVAATYSTFKTTAVKPEIPVLKVDSKTTEIGIGDVPVFKWESVAQVDYYKLHVFDEDENEISVIDNIKGTTCSSDAVQQPGTYTAQIESFNSVGTKGLSEPVSFEVKPNVNVTFVDADSFVDVDDEEYTPEVIGRIEVAWGHDAEFETVPEHNGYTFTGWSESLKNVEEDITVKAQYDINSYTVKFVDSKSGETLKTDTVNYYDMATPPDYSVESGHAKLGYDGWDKDYHCITEDTVFNTCEGWYDDELPIFATITNAIREYDSSNSDDEGYTVTLNLRNWENGTTKGRVVVALKTAEGKLLTSTESAAFTIKASATKDLEVFVPYENAASIAEAYVIGQYKDAVPISTTNASNNATYTIDQSNTMTSWSEEEPPVGARNVERKVEYRYQDKQTTTSYSTSLAGYTQSGGSWQKSGSGTIDYVPSFPSGFNKSSAYYTKYNGVKPKTASETATTKTVVSTSTVGYIYWHWCRGNTSGPGNRLVSDCKEGSYTHWHSLSQSSPITFDSSAKSFYKKDASICKDSYWWMTTYANKSTQLAIKRCTYTDYKKLFTYYRWTDWSSWSTTPATASANKKVESRTMYRYQLEGTMDEDNSGVARTISGNIDPSFAGKEATLFIYKINEASDFTNEYVAQTVIGQDGGYEFNFKLREEPSEETGDMTVALGVQGTTTPIFLDPILAPVKDYTVKYYDYDQKTLLKTEVVPEHGNAQGPDVSTLVREGYTFSNWIGSDMNVTEDRNLYAEYKINTYNVVFVDWKAHTVSMEKFDYGAPLVAPQPEEPDESMTVEWDKIADGTQTVTEDLIVTTRYLDKELDVKVYEEDGKNYDVQKVKYGMAADLPKMESTDKKEFLGWEEVSGDSPEGMTDSVVTKNSIIVPVYVYNETVADPVASLEQGVYNSAQTVTLSCDTPGADIYYTLDGSDPTELNSKLYTGPITIDDAAELQFYACKFEMNDSNVQRCLYSVNYDGATSKLMTEEELPEEVSANMEAYNVHMWTGYRYKDIRRVTTLAEAAVLENSGWEADSTAADTYTAYSAWADELPADISDYINVDVETEPVYETADQFKYSHYVYEDGVTKYSPTPVDGFECEYEEIGPFDQPLNVSKDANNNWMYSYDGQPWYNQTEISGQIQTGTRYRWRYQEVQYTKWDEWTTTKPSAGEEREYESATVFNYTRDNYYIVTVHFGDETWSYLAKEGSLADLEDPNGNDWDNTSYAYDVIGVYTDKNYTNEWNVETDTISDSTELFVKTEKKSFDVNFVDIDGNEISTQSVEYGESANAPTAPNVDGYAFVGWDTEDYTSVKYDMYVHARYVPEDEYATVTLDNESLTLYKNKSVDLTAIVSPSVKADAELTWMSSDESVACVSDTGRVTGLGAGTADITVKVNETGETAVCRITVKVDNISSLVLIKNDKLNIDGEGFLRGAKGNKDTVEDILAYFDNANLKCVNMEGEEVEPTDLFGTGFKIQLMAEEAIKDAVEAVVTGDFSGDGSINNKDVALLLRHLMDQVEPTPAQVRAGDVNGSGRVDARDAVLTLRVIVGKDSLD